MPQRRHQRTPTPLDPKPPSQRLRLAAAAVAA